MQREAPKFIFFDKHLIIDARDFAPTKTRQIILKAREFDSTCGFEFELLDQFALYRLQRTLARIHRAAETSPVIWIKNVGDVVPQLHNIATVLKQQYRNRCISRVQPA